MSRRYEDDRSRVSRNSRRYDDRYVEEEIDVRRGGPVPRERDVVFKERERTDQRIPDFLRDDYGRSSGAGPLVLRAREREDIEYAPRPRRRSPSPEPPRQDREEIVIRREERSESRPPAPRPREVSREREEIIIRRDERSESRQPPSRVRERSREREEIIIRRDEREPRRPPPPRAPSVERQEIIIRSRDERESRRPPPRAPSVEREEIIFRRTDDDLVSRKSYKPPPQRVDYERDEIIIRREDTSVPPPRARERSREREEIIIRREERDDDIRPRYGTRRYEDDHAAARPVSRERARSRAPSDSFSEDEIIIRRDERKGRGVDRERQEIIIRRTSRSRSPSPAPSIRPAPAPAPEPQIIYAPQIHQEVVTHHRHVDHGYEIALRPRVVSRPPSPPSPPPPPPPRERSEERIEIRREGTRNGRSYEEDIIIDRNEGGRSAPPARERLYDVPVRESPPPTRRANWEERAVAEEAEYYNERAMQRGYPGEAYHGATKDWALVDVPPGTRRVRMDGAGGGAQEITWQRYNGVRRSKFNPDGSSDEGYGSEIARPMPRPAPIPDPEPSREVSTGGVGPRYGKQKDPRDGLWTEITKDLVVKEAIIEMGYEYEETDDFYYIISYLRYDDVARLVGLSEDIRKDRRKRLKEIEWENRVTPPAPEPRLAIEAPNRISSPAGGRWDREDERYIEREIIYRGGRPPPPVGWRR